MNRSLIPAQHKLAEKLTILNHRGLGMLTRIYNIKKVHQPNGGWKVFRIGTVRYNWPMSAHASQAFSIAHCTDSEDLL